MGYSFSSAYTLRYILHILFQNFIGVMLNSSGYPCAPSKVRFDDIHDITAPVQIQFSSEIRNSGPRLQGTIKHKEPSHRASPLPTKRLLFPESMSFWGSILTGIPKEAEIKSLP